MKTLTYSGVFFFMFLCFQGVGQDRNAFRMQIREFHDLENHFAIINLIDSVSETQELPPEFIFLKGVRFLMLAGLVKHD